VEGGKRGTIFVYELADLQRIARDAIAQSMALANMQVLIAIVIGVLGVVNTLLISVLQRTREIGLIRAIGMTRRQASRIVVLEAFFVSIIAGIIGILGGILAGWFPLRAFALAVTGFDTPVVVPWVHALAALLVAVIIGLLASMIPARRAARVNVLQAIGYE
jgi:putative ABC transport system permease protein